MKESHPEQRHGRERRRGGNHELDGMRVLTQREPERIPRPAHPHAQRDRRKNDEAGGRQEQSSQQHAGDCDYGIAERSSMARRVPRPRPVVNGLTRLLAQEKRRVRTVREVEHVHDASRRRIECAATQAPTVQPIVLDEARDGRLRDVRMAHVIGPGPGRYYEERRPRTGTAPTIDRLAGEAQGLGALAAERRVR